MHNVSGQSNPSDQFDPMCFLDDDITDILNLKTEHNKDNVIYEKLGKNLIEFFVAPDSESIDGPFQAFSLASKHNIKSLEIDEFGNIDLKKQVLFLFKRHANGQISISLPEDKKEKFLKFGVILHRKGQDNNEIIEDLRERKIVYIGLNNEQYKKIFSVANSIILTAAEEDRKNKEENLSKNPKSFYNRFGYYEIMSMRREWNELIKKIVDSDFAKKIMSIKQQLDFHKILKRKLEHNSEEREKDFEDRMEHYKQQDNKKEILKNDNKRVDLNSLNVKSEKNKDEKTK